MTFRSCVCLCVVKSFNKKYIKKPQQIFESTVKRKREWSNEIIIIKKWSKKGWKSCVMFCFENECKHFTFLTFKTVQWKLFSPSEQREFIFQWNKVPIRRPCEILVVTGIFYRFHNSGAFLDVLTFDAQILFAGMFFFLSLFAFANNWTSKSFAITFS